MANQIVIWGIPKGQKYEDCLYTKAQTIEEAKKVQSILENKYGVSNIRIAEYSDNEKPDFANIF